jgi:signal transduction histidine kinase/DNA-binding response OmpR family regulator
MIVDSRNDLWVACLGVGVYQYNGDKWIIHGPQTGLETKNVIYLLEDTFRGHILALTDRGFFQFDGTSWTPWGFPMDLPLKRENHTVFQSSDGAIWLNFSSRSWLLERKGFGRHNYKFQTIRYMPDTVPPDTYVSVPTGRFPEGGQIQIEFKGSDFWGDTPKQELVYSWSLDGDNWSPFTRKSSITFSSLSGGKYELLVRARDRDGNLDSTPSRTVFRVIPPLWKRAWFILLVVVAITLIVFLLYALYRVRIKAALALDEFKFDFFTNISHELRNPLAVIISPVEMLLDSDFDTGTRKKLQIVLRNARKMQVMVDQLLAFRQIEKNRWTLNSEGGEIIGFAREALMNNEPLWQNKNQSLSFRASKELHLCSFDPSIVQKVIDNLVSNAAKYSDEGASIVVQVAIDQIDGHDQFVFEIEDDGPGIPLHEQKNVLQPFYRIRNATREEGSGVGLALVNQLVKLCGGTIEIRSPVAGSDRGTHFTVVIPLEPYKAPVQEKAPDVISSSIENGKPTVLFVEDNEDMRHILCDAFSSAYGVIEAGDGDAGLAAAIKHNPDIVVSDVMMGGLNGLELCERLKTDPETSHIPVILLTARSSVEHRIEGIQCGADAYIPKPLDVKHLRARVENLLESRSELKRRFARQLVIEATEITVTPTDEKILQQAIRIVEEHMRDEDFDVDRFATLMGMSRSSIKRKLKAITGQSPQPFIQKLRLKRAAQLLTSGDLPVSEVAAMVGFYDVSYFGKVFKKEFGYAPSLYREGVE